MWRAFAPIDLIRLRRWCQELEGVLELLGGTARQLPPRLAMSLPNSAEVELSSMANKLLGWRRIWTECVQKTPCCKRPTPPSFYSSFYLDV